MSSESYLPTIPIPEDSPILAIPTSESTAAEENRVLRLRMLEIWDAWSNGREPPSAIPGFSELLPRASGTSNIPINYPNTPLGYPTISAHFTGTPSEFLYNIDIAPDRNSLSNLKKKSSENFREYDVKWNEQAARVKLPMDETEMNMMSAVGKSFAEAIKIGEMVENGLKTGRILSQSTIRATSQEIQSGSGGVANRKKKEEVAMAASSLRNPRQPRSYFPPNTPQHYYPPQDVAYAMAPQPYAVMNAQPYTRPQQQFNQNLAPLPINNPPHQAPYNPRPLQNNFPYNARAKEPPRRNNFTPIEQKRILLKDEEIPNVTNNPLSAHNNGPVIGMICEDKEFDPALKAIIAIAVVEKKPRAAAKQDKGEKKSKSTPQSAEKTVETKTGAVPPKDAILYVSRAHRKEQLTLSPPKRFEWNKGPKMYVPKGTYVARGPVISPRLNEPVVIARAPQKPTKDPTAIPWNYNKVVVTYKGKEVIGEANETNPTEKYLNLEDFNKAKKKRVPLKKPVSAEEAEEFFRKMKTADYDVIDQLRKSPSQVSLLSLLVSSTKHQKVLIKTLNEAYVPIKTTFEQLERMVDEVNQISFSKNDFPLEGAAHNKDLHLTVKCEGYYVKRVMLDGGSGVDICPLSTLQRMEIGIERIRPDNVCVRAFDGIKRDTIGEIVLILNIGPVDFEVRFQVLDIDNSYNFLLGRPLIHAAGAIPSTLHQMLKFEHDDQEIMVHGEDEQSIYRDSSVPCLKAREGSEHIVYQAFEMIRHSYKPGKVLGESLQGIKEPITLAASEKSFGVGFHATTADVTWANCKAPENFARRYRISGCQVD
ncbi:PREDICTED: uncharacterized protein LOC109215064 [Nicotiana attenuata]|uniref:uncharacterized protein LOC109215064 n=1 Tax=Nicotiana attenuata TaxID=49451 RepID=UPI00090540A8|nr:PREDICTED: uncharacterized protein LOC109215064 [Nicotiana attenuata]